MTAILEELREHSTSSTRLFPSRSKTGYRAILHKVTCRIRERSGVEFIPHDLRRTAASYMTSFGVPRLVVSKILNHVEHGVTAVYDRYSYDRDKRLALDAWADALLTIVASDPEDRHALRSVDDYARASELRTPRFETHWEASVVSLQPRPAD